MPDNKNKQFLIFKIILCSYLPNERIKAEFIPSYISENGV